MSGSTGALADAVNRKRLNADSRGFADASLAFGQAVAAGAQSDSASPQMLSALSRWRRDAQRAQAQVAALPHGVGGKDVAIHALQKLSDALDELTNALSLNDSDRAPAAFARALQKLKAYHALAAKLDRRLR